MMAQTETLAQFDLVKVLSLIWRRKLLILLFGLIGAVLALLYSTSVPKMYQADGSVVVRSAALTSPDPDAAFSASGANEALVTTEQEVLTAPGLLERLSPRLDIPPALLESHSLGQQLKGLLHAASGYAGAPAQRWADEHLAILFPQAPANKLAEQETRLQFIRSALSLSFTKNSSVINLRATTRDPQLSADIVNGVLDIYMEDRTEELNHAASLIETTLHEQLRHTKQQIADGQERLAELQRQPGAIDSSEVPSQVSDIALIGTQLTQAQAELARRQADLNSATQLRGANLSNAQDGTGIAELRRMLAEQQGNYGRLSSTLGSNHPNALAAQRQIAALQAQIAAEASRGIEQRRADLAAAQGTVASLQNRLDRLRTRRRAATPQTLDIDQQKEAVASLWRLSEVLETRLIDMAARPVNLNARILTRAMPPTLAAFPNRNLYGLGGFVLAAGAGLMLVLLRSYMHLSRPVPIHLARQLKAPLLGGLPRLSGGGLPLAGERPGQRRLLTSAVSDRQADTLSAVALEVEHVIQEGGQRCLMMVSARKREGKTTVAVALGRALAGSGLRVLLVDMDLRRPSVEQVLTSGARSTISKSICELDEGRSIDILVEEESGIHTYTPKAANPYIDPLRNLRSPELQTIVSQLRSRYDLVLFDTPSLLSLPHAQVIAGMVDSILLVTQLGRSSERELEEFSRRVTRTGRPICGVIVTNVRPEDTYWEAY